MPLVLGNQKLGQTIHQWSLRSGSDCPGKTELCSKHCYAAHGHFLRANVKQAHLINRHLTDSPDFVSWMNLELKLQRATVVRIHADGDFYDAEYVRKWTEICRLNPHITFYAYTRSWRTKAILPDLEEMAKLKNMSLWFSVDSESGLPDHKPRRVRLAYMQVAPDDLPAKKVDLVFRIGKLRKNVAKRVTCADNSESFVCPVENGVTHTTCDKCKVCFRDAKPNKQAATRVDRRIALSLVR